MLLRQVPAQAQARGVPVRLHVGVSNRARRLYERLGFATAESTGGHHLMERHP